MYTVLVKKADRPTVDKVLKKSGNIKAGFHIFPNPLNTKTQFHFSLPKNQKVKLQIFDPSGRLVFSVFDGRKSNGNHTIPWKPGKLNSGVHIAKMQIGKMVFMKSLFLVK
jgi:flagellar hook assembly protein FlgD